MLYWLLYEKLFPFFHPFRIFRYLTFRTAFASLTALMIALFIGPYVIQKLREFQIGQYVRDDGPQTHLKKTGTPTMGGVLICIAILLPTFCGPTQPTPSSGSPSFPHSPSAPSALPTTTSRLSSGGTSGSPHGPNSSPGSRRRRGRNRALALHAVQDVLDAMSVPFIKSLRPDMLWHWPASSRISGFLAFLPFVFR